MKIKKIIPIVLITLLFVSCGPTKIQDKENIDVFESELFSQTSGMIDKNKANEIVDLYIAYAEKYPEDSLSSEYLFKAADISMNMNLPTKAINLYKRIRAEYPDFRKAPECLFLTGYIYENYLGNLDEARVIYQEFIDKYPENDFADDAIISIENLGKSPEELIKEFEAKQQEAN